MLTARMMKRVLHGRYCLVMDQLIRKDIHLSSPGSPLEKTLAQHRPPTLLLQGFHTWADRKTQVSFLLSLLKQIVNSFISTRRILLLLGLFWFSNLSKSWRINRIADFQQPTYTVLLVHAHRFLFWVHSQAKFWVVFVPKSHLYIFYLTFVFQWRSLPQMTSQRDEGPSASPSEARAALQLPNWRPKWSHWWMKSKGYPSIANLVKYSANSH